MTEFRRYALFQLVVIGLAAVAVAIVYSIFHSLLASLAGFSVLALLGLWPIVRRRSVEDERDEAIQRQAGLAGLAGHVALWLALVAWSVSVSLVFGERGSVPMVWVAPVIWVAWWLVTLVRSVTILVLDRRGS